MVVAHPLLVYIGVCIIVEGHKKKKTQLLKKENINVHSGAEEWSGKKVNPLN